MSEVYIVDAIRTPIGKRGGALSGVHPIDLGAHVVKALVERTGIDPSDVDDVIFGCVDAIGGQAGNIARMSWLAAGFPEHVSRGDRRPSVRFEPAGSALRRSGHPVGHRGSDRCRRRSEHEPDPDLGSDDRRSAVRIRHADFGFGRLDRALR